MLAQPASFPLLFLFFFQVLLFVYVFVWGNSGGEQEHRTEEISYDDSTIKKALNEVYKQQDEHKIQVRELRQLVAKMLCNGDIVLPHGGWCLSPDPANTFEIAPGVPMAKHHLAADAPLADALAHLFVASSVLDLGAGIGQYEFYWQQKKLPIVVDAYDGALNVEEYTLGRVRWADLSRPFTASEGQYNWVLSLEVGEHIPAQYMQHFIDNIDRHNRCGVVLSWAIPGQGGHSHVNTQPNSAIIQEMERRGYSYDESASMNFRKLATYPWFKNTIMVYHKKSAPSTCQR